MNDLDTLTEEIKAEVGGKALLSKQQAAKALSTSTSTLDRWRSEGIGPEYQKRPGKSGRVVYHARELARFMIQTSVKTA